MHLAIAELKRGQSLLQEPDELSQLLCNAFADKGLSPDTLRYWLENPTSAHALGQLIGHGLLRLPYDSSSHLLQQSLLSSIGREPQFTYAGTAQQNMRIDASVADSWDRSGYRDSIRHAAACYFSLQGCRLPAHRPQLSTVPAVVLGAGAAGTLATRTLVNAGYHHVTVLDKRGHYGGIWNYPNVQGGSRNNPIALGYEQFRVEPAPGCGKEITTFLETLAHPPASSGLLPLPVPQKAKILRVQPGDLAHRVTYRDAEGEHQIETPLLINTLGLGSPLAPSRPGVMTTDQPASAAGVRWQQVLTLEQVRQMLGKTIVFIGLGNSTAEMLVQLQQFRAAGLDLRYKVLTHYPQMALDYPHSDEEYNGKRYRLYRDIQQPRLTKLAGDLDHIEQAFEQARDSTDREQEEIIASVRHWTLDHTGQRPMMQVTLENGQQRRFPCDQLYSLIGYGHRKEELEAQGMWVTDDYLGTIAADYDGEIQRLPGMSGRGRLFPGYFALGALLRTPQNPNAQVIPGMLYRLADLSTMVMLRSAEYLLRQPTRQLTPIPPQATHEASKEGLPEALIATH